MTTIAEVEVQLRTNLTKYKSGLDSAKKELTNFESHNRTVAGQFESMWLRSIKNVVMAYVGFRAIWGTVQAGVQDGITALSEAIRTQLRPALDEMNNALKQMAASKTPSLLASGLLIVYDVLKVFFDGVIMSINSAIAGIIKFTGYMEYAGRYIRDGPAAAQEILNKRLAEAEPYYKNAQDHAQNIRDAWADAFKQVQNILGGGTYSIPKLPDNRPAPAAGAAPKATKPLSLMETYEASTYYDPETGHNLRRTPEQQAVYAASQQSQSMNNNITINIESLNSTDAPLVISSKIAQAIAAGAPTSKFMP